MVKGEKNTIYYTWYTTANYIPRGGRKTLTEARKECYGILAKRPDAKLDIETEILLPHPYRPNEYGAIKRGKEFGTMFVGKEGIIWHDKATKKKYVLNKDGTLGRRIA